MLIFGEKGTIDGFTFLEVNKFVPKFANKATVFKADIEFDVFAVTVYRRHEKRVANWIKTVNNLEVYEFKYNGLNYQFSINLNNLG